MTLGEGEGVGGMLAGGGRDQQGVALYDKKTRLGIAQTSGVPYFEPFTIFPPEPGTYDLRIFDGETQADMWVDSIRKVKRRHALSDAKSDTPTRSIYYRWIKDLFTNVMGALQYIRHSLFCFYMA